MFLDVHITLKSFQVFKRLKKQLLPWIKVEDSRNMILISCSLKASDF